MTDVTDSRVSTRSLVVPRHARVGWIGDPATATEAWLVLHGYGMTARGILHWFRDAAAPHRVLVAPEGLSRFYQERRGIRTVGASWMTSDDRDNEIIDQRTYLDSVADAWLAGRERIELHGFSQGVSTACRWLVAGNRAVDRLVGWAGVIPPDLDLELLGARSGPGPVHLVVGARDSLVPPAQVAADRDRLEAAGIATKLHPHEGGHGIDAGVLATFAG